MTGELCSLSLLTLLLYFQEWGIYNRLDFDIIQDVVWVQLPPHLHVPLLGGDIAKSSQGTWLPHIKTMHLFIVHLQYVRLYEGCYSGFTNEQDTGPSLKELSVLCV